jgi:glycosyltransferase involved in cell wall biosynthesis
VKEPLRILYHHRIRSDDGQAVHVRELVHALREIGCEVRECALVPKSTSPATPAGRGRRGFWARLRLPRLLVELLEVLYSHRARRVLAREIRAFRPHLVYERHALHCHAGLDAAVAAGLPLFLEVNSPMVDEMSTLRLLRFARLARATERRVLGGATRVLAVSDVLARMLVELGAPRGRVEVVRNGAEPARCGPQAVAEAGALRTSLGLAPGAFVLGFVGYVRDWHRLDLVLDAMQLPGLADLHLLVVGTGPALPALVAQAAARGLTARLHLAGEQPADRVPAHVLAMDATLVPAINPYASPLKLFDALAAGVPVVAPDQPNLRELLQHGTNGLLFREGDATSLAEQVRSLVEDRELARRIGRAGLELLQREDWTWKGNARRVVRAYAALGERTLR